MIHAAIDLAGFELLLDGDRVTVLAGTLNVYWNGDDWDVNDPCLAFDYAHPETGERCQRYASWGSPTANAVIVEVEPQVLAALETQGVVFGPNHLRRVNA